MFIQVIPPFKGGKKIGGEEKKSEAAANGQAAPIKAPASAKPAIGKLNVNASSFRPNPNAASFTPVGVNAFFNLSVVANEFGHRRHRTCPRAR